MLMSIEHLSKTYAVKPVLDDVSFAIEERDKIALVGINGTGKTTLLRLLNDQEQATAAPSSEKKICGSPCWNRSRSSTMRRRSLKR